MCASTRSRPNKRAAVVFASGAKKAPVAAQPPAPADKKPAAVRRPIAGPTGVPGPTVPASIRPTGVPGRTVPAIRPMATCSFWRMAYRLRTLPVAPHGGLTRMVRGMESQVTTNSSSDGGWGWMRVFCEFGALAPGFRRKAHTREQ